MSGDAQGLSIAPAAGDKPAAVTAGEGTGTTKVTIDTTPKPAAPAADPNRPKWLPEKFKTPEDFAAAYKELETKQGAKPAAEPDNKPAIDTSKVDMPALAKEFAEKGKLSPETLKSLETKGIPAAAVDAYVAGLQAQAGALRSSLIAVAGGEDQLKAIYDWAGQNLSQAEVTAYNAQVNSGNTETAKLALSGIVSKYAAATGTDPKLVSGEETPAGGEAGFASDAEIVAAMSDPRYAIDEAYRKQVAKRMEKTEMFSLRY